jgi:beta-lactamase superfamily II metal-dependent hydrolase
MIGASPVRKRAFQFCCDYGRCVALLSISILLILTSYIFISAVTTGKLKVTFLDIGQGDAILIQTPSGYEMLVDGGPSRTVVEKIIHELPYLDRTLDVVVETHPDADHITGLIPVLDSFRVSNIVTSPLDGHTGIFDELNDRVTHEGAQVYVAKAGDVIDFGDGVIVYVLYPNKNFQGRDKATNDASVSLLVVYGDESVLLTGDLPSSHEGELISKLLPQGVTIYKAGHHGSKYSSGEQLLSYIRPEYAVISAGKDNKYGHPNPEAVERLRKYSKEVLSTIDHGSITFELDGKGIDVLEEK